MITLYRVLRVRERVSNVFSSTTLNFPRANESTLEQHLQT